MKNYKPGKSANPGKIDRHRASLARRSFFVRMGLMSQLKNFCWSVPESSNAESSAYGTLRATALQIRAVLPLIAAVALGYGVNRADASVIEDINFGQAGGQSEAIFYLQNNDSGVTYDSAELKYDGLLNSVAQAVKDNNLDYANKTLDEIKGEWAYGVSPGEVKDGWSANLNSEILDLSHGSFGVDTWYSTSDDADQDEMAISVNFFDQLDFNHNDSFDSATEALQWDGPLVTDAFTGIVDIDNMYKTDANAVTVIPEPVTMGLLGMGGLLILVARRFLASITSDTVKICRTAESLPAAAEHEVRLAERREGLRPFQPYKRR